MAFAEIPVVDASGHTLVGEVVDCRLGECDPATTVGKQQRVSWLVARPREVSIVRAAGVAEAGFDAVIEHSYAECERAGPVGGIRMLDDVGRDLADSRGEFRAPRRIGRPRPDVTYFAPQLGQSDMEIIQVLRNCRDGNFEFDQRTRLRVQSVPPPPSGTV